MTKQRPVLTLKKDKAVIDPATDLANRIWAGQSPDLLVKERHARIMAAIEHHNLDKTNLVLPT